MGRRRNSRETGFSVPSALRVPEGIGERPERGRVGRLRPDQVLNRYGAASHSS